MIAGAVMGSIFVTDLGCRCRMCCQMDRVQFIGLVVTPRIIVCGYETPCDLNVWWLGALVEEDSNVFVWELI